jgi:RNA polymerase sigma-70 factor, ECF subfamily
MLVRSDLPAKGDLNLYKLYSDYTDQWINKQSRRRGAIMSAAQRRRFVEKLAATLLVEGLTRLHFSRLYEVAREFSGYGDATRLDYFDADARTCTFLTRDGKGNYGFRHRSFFEYFCATCIADDIERSEGQLLAARSLTAEVLEFLVARTLSHAGLQNLQLWSNRFDQPVLSRNSVSLLLALRQPLDSEVEARYRTSTAEWEGFRHALRADESGAVDRLLEEYGPKLILLAGRISHQIPGPMEPEDLANEALVRLWELARKGRLEAREILNLEAYLYNVMRMIAVDAARRHAKDATLLTADSIDVAAEAANPEQVALSTEVRERVVREIELLPPAYREVVRLTFYDDLSIGEIADKLNMSISSVSQKRYRGIKLLATKIGGLKGNWSP